MFTCCLAVAVVGRILSLSAARLKSSHAQLLASPCLAMPRPASPGRSAARLKSSHAQLLALPRPAMPGHAKPCLAVVLRD